MKPLLRPHVTLVARCAHWTEHGEFRTQLFQQRSHSFSRAAITIPARSLIARIFERLSRFIVTLLNRSSTLSMSSMTQNDFLAATEEDQKGNLGSLQTVRAELVPNQGISRGQACQTQSLIQSTSQREEPQSDTALCQSQTTMERHRISNHCTHESLKGVTLQRMCACMHAVC